MHFDYVELGSSVDCVTFRVNEFRLYPSTASFDYKTHCCAMEYEFGLVLPEQRVVLVNGPRALSIHDITVFRVGDLDKEEK